MTLAQKKKQEWISMKDKPQYFLEVNLKCSDGVIRPGIYDPQMYPSPWIYTLNLDDPYESFVITDWSPR